MENILSRLNSEGMVEVKGKGFITDLYTEAIAASITFFVWSLWILHRKSPLGLYITILGPPFWLTLRYMFPDGKWMIYLSIVLFCGNLTGLDGDNERRA